MRFFKGLVLVLSLAVVSCKSGEKRVEAPRKVKGESVVAAAESVESGSFAGKVVAATDVNLGFRVAGIIAEICAEDGAYVREGEVIARLDSRDYALQLAATQAEYDAVKAEVDRVVALYADESVSANAYDKATNGLRAITAKLSAHKNALADTELRAPVTGFVHKSNFAKGEAVAAGTPVISMISSAAPEITIDIPAAYYLRQDAFVGATATIDLYPGVVFNLKLKGMSPKANLNQLYRVTFIVQGVDGVVPSVGMSAMVQMKYAAESDASVVVPFSAVVESAGGSAVWVIEDGCVRSREVAVREIRHDGDAVITSGLAEGEVVVTAGVNSLKDGQRVELLEEASQANVGGLK